MNGMNCWEVLRCGREPGGIKAQELGVCSAATFRKAHGIHRGRNAGRCCWIVAGTLCRGKPECSFVPTVKTCLNCDFYTLVRSEEGEGFLTVGEMKDKLER